MKMRTDLKIAAVFLISVLSFSPARADDSAISRSTLIGMKSIGIFVEKIQPNIQKYAQKSGLEASLIRKEIEQRLQSIGIRVVEDKEWLNTSGRPFLYVNINTHETEKYWYAYDVKVEVWQGVYLEAAPKVKTMAVTWSMNMTGMVNIGNVHLIHNDMLVMVDKFIQAYQEGNKK